MKFSKATNYALHSVVHLAMEGSSEAIRVEDLADRQNLSPTYLSKILTKLTKAGMIESTPSVKGGYRLAKPASECTFLEVIEVTEGGHSLLKCTMNSHEQWNKTCLIERAMSDVEEEMKKELEKNNRRDSCSGEKELVRTTNFFTQIKDKLSL